MVNLIWDLKRPLSQICKGYEIEAALVYLSRSACTLILSRVSRPWVFTCSYSANTLIIVSFLERQAEVEQFLSLRILPSVGCASRRSVFRNMTTQLDFGRGIHSQVSKLLQAETVPILICISRRCKVSGLTRGFTLAVVGCRNEGLNIDRAEHQSSAQSHYR